MTLEIGSDIIHFELKGTDEKMHSTTDHSNKKVLAIVFSCNHCPYVVASEKEFISLQNEFGDQGFQMIAVNPNNSKTHPGDNFSSMVKRYEEKKFNFIYLRDKKQEVAKKYDAKRTPEFFIYNEDRKLVYTGRINDNPMNHDEIKQHDVKNAISEILAGKEVSKPRNVAIGCSIKWL